MAEVGPLLRLRESEPLARSAPPLARRALESRFEGAQ